MKETNVARREVKYFIDEATASRVRASLDAILMPRDPHGGADGYMVRSLYFDTVYDGDYHDKVDGLEIRRKIRLRVYSPDDAAARLEIKQKRGGEQWKRSVSIPREDVPLLVGGRYREAREKFDSPAARSIVSTMEAEGYIPRTMVEYRRLAYMLETDNTRVTFDTRLRATEAGCDLFSRDPALYPVMAKTVLEVKYTNFLLSHIRGALMIANMLPVSASKYCLGRQIAFY
jgi:hypothetical protein